MNLNQRKVATLPPPRSDANSSESQVRKRLHMYHHNRAELELMVRQGELTDLAEPVLLIADMDDEYGASLARFHGVDDERPCGPEAIPTLLVSWERDDMLFLLKETHPETAVLLEAWKREETPVLIIAAGGITLVGLELGNDGADAS